MPIASLHADHVAADNARRINFLYSQGQLMPPVRIPGFIFHQTERTADDGRNPCFGGSTGEHDGYACFDANVRDFDLLG